MTKMSTKPTMKAHVTHRLHELTFRDLTDRDIDNIILLFRQIEENSGFIGDDIGRLNDMLIAFEKALCDDNKNYMSRWM